MLNIKKVFAPTDFVSQAPLASAVSSTPPVFSPASPTLIKTKSNRPLLQLVLGAVFLTVLATGGATAFWLNGRPQDLRQNASTDMGAGIQTPRIYPNKADWTSPKFTCTAAHLGSACVYPPEAAGGVWNGRCVFSICPNGDTNGDRACGVPGDVGATYEFMSCDAAKAKAAAIGNVCYQFDATTDPGIWCVPDPNICIGYEDNLDVCSPVTPTPPPPTPTPTVAAPTPTPRVVVPPQCTNIKMLNASGIELFGDLDKSLKPGDAVKFMCSGTGTVAKYDFRVILPNGQIETRETNPALVAVGATTGNYVIPAAGKFTAQCRVCAQPTQTPCRPDTICNIVVPPLQCAEWEGVTVVPTTPATSSCSGPHALLCPANYQCVETQTGAICNPIKIEPR